MICLATVGSVGTGCSQSVKTISVGSCQIDPMPANQGNVAPNTTFKIDKGQTTVHVDDIGDGGVVNIDAPNACIIVEGTIGNNTQIAASGKLATVIIHSKLNDSVEWDTNGDGGVTYLSDMNAYDLTSAMLKHHIGGHVNGKDGPLM
jgi:hypothetical protein